jgi:hypothetical protein
MEHTLVPIGCPFTIGLRSGRDETGVTRCTKSCLQAAIFIRGHMPCDDTVCCLSAATA